MKKRILINGMHCAGCVNSVEKALKSVEGVKSANVQLTTEVAEIEFLGDQFPSESVTKAIENAGYEVVEPSNDTVTFNIGGMHCTGCSSAVEKALKRNEGVSEAVVNLTAEKAFVEFDSGRISLEELKNSIENAGYEVLNLQKKK